MNDTINFFVAIFSINLLVIGCINGGISVVEIAAYMILIIVSLSFLFISSVASYDYVEKIEYEISEIENKD